MIADGLNYNHEALSSSLVKEQLNYLQLVKLMEAGQWATGFENSRQKRGWHTKRLESWKAQPPGRGRGDAPVFQGRHTPCEFQSAEMGAVITVVWKVRPTAKMGAIYFSLNPQAHLKRQWVLSLESSDLGWRSSPRPYNYICVSRDTLQRWPKTSLSSKTLFAK